MSEWLIYLVFAVFIVLPMLPGLLEMLSRKDDGALPIDENYTRDPRYLGKSLREKVRALADKAAVGVRMQFLARRREYARVVSGLELPDNGRYEDVLLSRGAVVAGKGVTLLDVYAEGKVAIGANARLRTLAADDDASIGGGVSLQRWADAERDLTVGPDGDLGQSASSAQRLTVGSNVTFKRLFGRPVVVGASSGAPALPPVGAPERVAMIAYGGRDHVVSAHDVPEGETLDGDVIASGTVRVGAKATLKGSVKSGGDITIGPGARVLGNLVARGSVLIDRGAVVFGHVFADERVTLEPGAVVGTVDLPKTAYGGRSMRLAVGSCIYGWVITEGDGETFVADA
ncbi:MAG TPA: polymer-forming cytoskeletal protein [Candidatus Dormibacteraeota bacterium]|nr:polymer-forming cytoskeletal protein [Candidatus Dormibacteraeota bacterium]